MDPSGQAIAPAVERPAEPNFDVEQYPEWEVPRWRTARLCWENRDFLWRSIRNTFLITLLITFIIPKHYQSTAALMPPSLEPSMLDMINGLIGLANGPGALTGGSASSSLGKLLNGSDEGELYVGVMGSQTMEKRIIDRFGLMKKYHEKYVEDAQKDLESQVDIETDRKSGVISITVTDKDPEFAAALAQGYVDEFTKIISQVTISSAHRERVFLEQRMKTAKAALDDDSYQFSQFSSKNSTLDIPSQVQAMVGAAATLQGNIIAAEAQLNGLKQIYTPDNFRVKQTEAQIAELNKELNKMGGKDVSLDAQSLSPDELYPSIRELPLLGVEWANLYRQLKIDETVYSLLAQQFELAKIEDAREVPGVDVLDPGFVPQEKSWPPRILLSILMAFLAAVTAGLWLSAKRKIAEWAPEDERKLLLQDVYIRVRSHRLWRSKWALRLSALLHWVSASARRVGHFLRRLVPFSSPATSEQP